MPSSLPDTYRSAFQKALNGMVRLVLLVTVQVSRSEREPSTWRTSWVMPRPGVSKPLVTFQGFARLPSPVMTGALVWENGAAVPHHGSAEYAVPFSWIAKRPGAWLASTPLSSS